MLPLFPDLPPPLLPPLVQRILRVVHRDARDPVWGCWLWPYATQTSGYGQVRDGDRWVLVHRMMHDFFFRPAGVGLMVLHDCDTPACCNPWHLYVGDGFDNARDAIARGRGSGGSPFPPDLSREIGEWSGSFAAARQHFGVAGTTVSFHRRRWRRPEPLLF